MSRKIPVLERIRRRTVIDEATGCWLYTGQQNMRGGHGIIGIKSNGIRRSTFVHRLMYELLVGPIPDGMCACHHCDVPNCFNPVHIFLGTVADNNRDMERKGRDYHRQGIVHRDAKLTPAIVRELRSRIVVKGSCEAWGKEFGVDPKTVWQVVHGRTWKSVG